MSSDKGTALGNGRIRLQNDSQPTVKQATFNASLALGPSLIDQIQKPRTPTVLPWTFTPDRYLNRNFSSVPLPASVSVHRSPLCLSDCLAVCFVKKCLCIFLRLIVFFSVMYIFPTISALHPSLILYLPQRPSVVSASIIHFHYTNISLTPLVCSPSAPIFTQAPNSSFTWKIMFKVKLTNTLSTHESFTL